MSGLLSILNTYTRHRIFDSNTDQNVWISVIVIWELARKFFGELGKVGAINDNQGGFEGSLVLGDLLEEMNRVLPTQ